MHPGQFLNGTVLVLGKVSLRSAGAAEAGDAVCTVYARDLVA